MILFYSIGGEKRKIILRLAHCGLHRVMSCVVFVVVQLIKPNQRCQQIKRPRSDASLFFSPTRRGRASHLAQMGHISASLTKPTLSPCVNGNTVMAGQPTKIHTGDQKENECECCVTVYVFIYVTVCVWITSTVGDLFLTP